MAPSEFLAHVVAIFERLEIPYIVTGSVAAMAYGEPRFTIDVREANFASPEDVIIKKLEYDSAGGSEKHLREITGMLVTSGARIDRDYIERWSATLGVSEIWKAIQARLDS